MERWPTEIERHRVRFDRVRFGCKGQTGGRASCQGIVRTIFPVWAFCAKAAWAAVISANGKVAATSG